MQRKIEIELAAKDSASSVFKRAGENVKRELESLNESVGRSSEFGHALHALKGAGATFALSEAGKILNELTSKAVELRDEFKEGKKSGGEVAEELAKSLPIFGNIISAGRQIHELFSSNAAESREISEQARLQTEYADSIIEAQRRIRDEHEKTLKTIRDINQESARVGFGGPEGQILALRQQQANSADDMQAELRKANEEIDKKYSAVIKEMQDRANRPDNLGIGGEALDSFKRSWIGKIFNPGYEGTENESSRNTQESVRAMLAGLQKQREEKKKKGQENLTAIEKAQAEKRNATIADLEKQAAELQAEENHKAEDVAYRHEEIIAQIQGDARRAALESMGQHAAAERDLLKENYERLVEEVQRRFERENADADRTGKSTPGDPTGELAALAKKYAADTAAANVRSQAEDAARQKTVQEQVAAIHRESLQVEVEGGSKLAALELQRLEIAEKYTRQRETINKELQASSGLTDRERQQLTQAQALANASERRELALVGRNGGGFSPIGAVDPGSPGLSGAAQHILEAINQRAEQAQAQQTANDYLKSIADNITTLVQNALSPTASVGIFTNY